MAFIKKPFQPSTTQSNQSGMTGAGAGDTAKPGQEQVSDWVNLNSIIEGNQGSGADMAAVTLAGGNKAADTAETSASTFASDVAKESRSGVKKDLSQDIAKWDWKNLTDGQVAAYGDWKKAPSYSGPVDPTKAKGYESLESNTNKAVDEVKKSSSLTDMAVSLNTTTLGKDNANYKGGMSMLDAILQRQAGGGAAIDALQAKGSTLVRKKDGAIKAADASIKSALDTAKGRDGSATAALNSLRDKAASDIESNRGQRAAGVVEREKAKAEAELSKDLNWNNLSDAEKSDAIQSTVGINTRDLTLADISSADELAALNRLNGMTDTDLSLATSGQGFDPSKVAPIVMNFPTPEAPSVANPNGLNDSVQVLGAGADLINGVAETPNKLNRGWVKAKNRLGRLSGDLD